MAKADARGTACLKCTFPAQLNSPSSHTPSIVSLSPFYSSFPPSFHLRLCTLPPPQLVIPHFDISWGEVTKKKKKQPVKSFGSCYCGRQDELEVSTLASKAVSPGFESRHSNKLSSRCFTGRVIHQCVCRLSDGC